MTLEELGRLQAAFGAQIGSGATDVAGLAPWLASDAASAARLARYGQALRQHHARSLELVYPVLQALGGAPWFLTLAQAYGTAHPSQSADLARFGAHLPAFLAHWPHALAYFADVARLEWLLHQVHGAPDQAPLTLQQVQAAGVDALATWQLRLHPAAVPYASEWRTVAIWLGHAEAGTHALPASAAGATQALVYRAGWSARVREVSAPEARALATLEGGATLGEALAAAQAMNAAVQEAGAAAFDPAPLFTRWLGDGILVRGG